MVYEQLGRPSINIRFAPISQYVESWEAFAAVEGPKCGLHFEEMVMHSIGKSATLLKAFASPLCVEVQTTAADACRRRRAREKGAVDSLEEHEMFCFGKTPL